MFSLIREKISDGSGQSTIEAAFSIPMLMILMLMLLQPSIILYDYIVMKGATSDGCRLLTTSKDSEGTNEDYIRRRLSAIPQVDIFHVHAGECSYQIDLNGNDTSSEVSVKVRNELKPLPLLDIGLALINLLDANGCLSIEVETSMPTHAEWAISSIGGRSPSEWDSWK